MFDRYLAPSLQRTRRPQLRLEALEAREIPSVGIGQNFAGGSGGSFAPPDTDGAIGPSHYVQFINGRFAVYNKANGSLAQSKTDTAFWNSAGISTAITNPGLSDPRMYYDVLSDRWFACELNTPNSANSVLVGRSDTNNPTGTWKATSYVGNANFADYPTLGVDANGVYIGTNNFISQLNSVSMTSIPKADLLLATPSVANRTTVEQTGFQMGYTLQGVTNAAASPAYASVVAEDTFTFGKVDRTKITGSGGPGATFGPTSIIDVANISHPFDARQPDGTQQIEGIDYRFGSMIYQVGDLIYGVHGLSVNSSGVAVMGGGSSTDAVRLTVLRDSTGTVAAEATWFNTNFDYVMPSVCANAFGDIVVGFTRSSANAGSGATDGRLGSYAVSARLNPANPGAGINFGTEVQLKTGQTTGYHLFGGSGERWGDYSATSVEPANPLAFWTTQEYAVGASTWGTWISQVFISPRAGNVTSTAANGTYAFGAVIPITVTFNNPVTVTGNPQIALNAGGGSVATYVSGSGTATLTFNYTVGAGQATADLDYTSTSALTLNGGTIKDTVSGLDAELPLAAPGAAGSLGANKNIVIDSLAAGITNVSSTAANGTYGLAATIPITVTFTSAVVVTGVPQLALNAGGTAAANYVSGTGTATLTFDYTVAAGQASADLDYSSTTALTLNGGTIKDMAGNQNAVLTLVAPGAAGSLGANKNIVIDSGSPGVSNVTSTNANGTYSAGATIQITVAFNKVVIVTGTPQLALNSGGTADYASGSGSSTLTFSYTIGIGDASADLDYTSINALTLNGGTIAEQGSGISATLTLPTPGGSGSLGANKNIVIDTAPPVVSNVTSPTANGTYLFGAAIQIAVTFNKAVAVTGTPQLTLNSGGIANYASGSGTTTLTFNYTVGANESSNDLDYASTGALTLNGGTIVEQSSGQNATLTLPAPGAPGSLGANKNLIVDGFASSVTNVTSPNANGTYLNAATLSITVTFKRAVLVTGTPQLALNSGGTATYASGSGTTTLTFSYTVAPGQQSLDLDYASSSALSLNGGTIKDQTTNQDATLTLPAPGAAGSLGANKNIIIDALGPVVVEFRVLFGRKKFNILGSSRFDLPWRITGIQVVFDAPVVTGNINSLTGIASTRFTGRGTNTLTWTFPAISKGSFAAALADSGPNAIKDAVGNPTAAFSQAFKVLYGDFTDDGLVDAADEAGVRANLTPPYNLIPSGYNIFADLSGDGLANLVDVGIARSRKGNSLP
jgi:hypothetical protein